MTHRLAPPQAPDSAVLLPFAGSGRGVAAMMTALAAVAVLVVALPVGVVASGFPRVTMLGCLLAALLTIHNPRYGLPAFLIVLAPLRLLGTTIRVQLGEYPVMPASLALAALAVTALACRWRPSPRLLAPDSTPIAIWAVIVGTAAPALWVTPVGGEATVTWLIFVMGVLEPALAFVLTLAWLRTYRDVRTFLVALLASSVCGLITGLVALRTSEFAISSDSLSILRFNLAGFGGANTSGFIMVLLYPLVLGFQASRTRDVVRSLVPMLAFMWGMALASLSRATPLVMGVQTLIYFLWSERLRRTVQIIVILGLTLGATAVFVPEDLQQAWSARFSETDLAGMLSGRPQHISMSDDARLQTRASLVEVIKTRPWGGYAAVGREDPENIYWDIALQLGWGPALGFLCLQVLLLQETWRAAFAEAAHVRILSRLSFCSLLGSVVYGALAGVNLVKAGSPAADIGFQANNMPALFFAVTAAFALFVAKPQDQAAGRGMVAPRSLGRAFIRTP